MADERTEKQKVQEITDKLSLPFFECDSAMATEKELDKPRIIRMDK